MRGKTQFEDFVFWVFYKRLKLEGFLLRSCIAKRGYHRLGSCEKVHTMLASPNLGFFIIELIDSIKEGGNNNAVGLVDGKVSWVTLWKN